MKGGIMICTIVFAVIGIAALFLGVRFLWQESHRGSIHQLKNVETHWH